MAWWRLLLGTSLFLLTATGRLAAADPPSFVKDVKPFLTMYCTECHGTTTAKAGLKLETYADMMKGGKKGKVVVAGKPDQSLLFRCIMGQGKAMPPKSYAKKPTNDEIAKLKAWITAGCKDDSKKVQLIPALPEETAVAGLISPPPALPVRRE
jgi:hypothetical protein